MCSSVWLKIKNQHCTQSLDWWRWCNRRCIKSTCLLAFMRICCECRKGSHWMIRAIRWESLAIMWLFQWTMGRLRSGFVMRVKYSISLRQMRVILVMDIISTLARVWAGPVNRHCSREREGHIKDKFNAISSIVDRSSAAIFAKFLLADLFIDQIKYEAH